MSETGFWEPWAPQVGQRVVIRVTPECRQDWGDGPWEHPDWANGLLGTIVRDERTLSGSTPARLGHPYVVDLDEIGPGGTLGLFLAAIELEPQ